MENSLKEIQNITKEVLLQDNFILIKYDYFYDAIIDAAKHGLSFYESVIDLNSNNILKENINKIAYCFRVDGFNAYVKEIGEVGVLLHIDWDKRGIYENKF